MAYMDEVKAIKQIERLLTKVDMNGCAGSAFEGVIELAIENVAAQQPESYMRNYYGEKIKRELLKDELIEARERIKELENALSYKDMKLGELEGAVEILQANARNKSA